MTGRFFTLIAIGCASLLVIEALLHSSPHQRNYEVFTEMAYSVANESMSPSLHLPGGTTQQPLVEGVVVRGHMPFRYGPGPEEAQRAGRELTNPYTDEPEVLARGAEVYGIFCVVCHAADGLGQGPVVLRGMPPPPSFMGARAKQIADGEMYHILTLGQGNMPSYAVQVPPEDRWKVIRYVRSLQSTP